MRRRITIATCEERHVWDRAQATGRAWIWIGAQKRWMRMARVPKLAYIAPVFLRMSMLLPPDYWHRLITGHLTYRGVAWLRTLRTGPGAVLVLDTRYGEYKKAVQRYVDQIP